MIPEFVFYHIPKCGGTSLREYLYNILKAKFEDDEIYYPRSDSVYRPVYGNNNLATGPETKRVQDTMPQDQFEKLKAILCHIKYDTDYLSFKQYKNVIDIVVMRDPIDRLMSHYNFFDTRLFDGKLICDLSSDQLRLYCESRGNVMFSYLRGRTDTGYIGTIDDAKRNIDKIKYKTTLENISSTLPTIAKSIMDDLGISCRLPKLMWLQKSSVQPTRYQELYDTLSEITEGFADNRLYKHLTQHA